MASKAEPYWYAGSSENGVRGSLRSLKRRVAALPEATAQEIRRERKDLQASTSGSDGDRDTNTAQPDASHGGATLASPDGKVGAAPDFLKKGDTARSPSAVTASRSSAPHAAGFCHGPTGGMLRNGSHAELHIIG
jgi:hypothetical protein